MPTPDFERCESLVASFTEREKRIVSMLVQIAWEGVAHDAGDMDPEDRWDAICENLPRISSPSRKGKVSHGSFSLGIDTARIAYVADTWPSAFEPIALEVLRRY